MSHPHARHAAPDPRATRTVRFWLAPIVITLLLMSALAALYLGGILRPAASLHRFPIAVVNEDAGPVGGQIVDGMKSGLDRNKFDLRLLTREEAVHQLNNAQIYGAVAIPPDLSATLALLPAGAMNPGDADRPIITVTTNPRAGTLGASIASQALTEAMLVANHKVGDQLSAQVAAQTRGAPIAGAVSLVLTNPIEIKTGAHNPLPDGTGNGLSAFYYSLLLLLAGFTGSIVVSTLVDSMLGYVPAEFGPVYRFAAQVKISRFRTLLIKWAVMVILAVLTSAVYMAIAHALGMPIQHGVQLWLYGVFAIVAVGVTSSSLIAVLGTMGLLVSMLIFVILGLPSAGATVPLQAAPPFFTWLAKFEPMHQVFLGARALLYLDGRADAGLSQSLMLTTVGLVIGLLLGGIVTRLYDRHGYHRISPMAETTSTADGTNHLQAPSTLEATPPSTADADA